MCSFYKANIFQHSYSAINAGCPFSYQLLPGKSCKRILSIDLWRVRKHLGTAQQTEVLNSLMINQWPKQAKCKKFCRNIYEMHHTSFDLTIIIS